jgi:hypothetical protein
VLALGDKVTKRNINVEQSDDWEGKEIRNFVIENLNFLIIFTTVSRGGLQNIKITVPVSPRYGLYGLRIQNRFLRINFRGEFGNPRSKKLTIVR